MADSVKKFGMAIMRGILQALLAIAVLFLLLWAGLAAYVHLTYERHVKKVDISVTIHPKGSGAICADAQGRPLFVDIVNNSTKTVEEVSFRLKARREGQAENLASRRTYSSDKMLKPGETWGGCLPAALQDDVTVDPLDLDWSVGGRVVTFQ